MSYSLKQYTMQIIRASDTKLCLQKVHNKNSYVSGAQLVWGFVCTVTSLASCSLYTASIKQLTCVLIGRYVRVCVRVCVNVCVCVCLCVRVCVRA